MIGTRIILKKNDEVECKNTSIVISAFNISIIEKNKKEG